MMGMVYNQKKVCWDLRDIRINLNTIENVQNTAYIICGIKESGIELE